MSNDDVKSDARSALALLELLVPVVTGNCYVVILVLYYCTVVIIVVNIDTIPN